MPQLDPDRRVLGVIRPTVERLGTLSQTRRVGVFRHTQRRQWRADLYGMEIGKLYGNAVHVSEMAAPMWVPLIENGEAGGDGADYFVRKYVDGLMAVDPEIDTLILGCTHYPILLPKICRYAPGNVNVMPQGGIVADSLAEYHGPSSGDGGQMHARRRGEVHHYRES